METPDTPDSSKKPETADADGLTAEQKVAALHGVRAVLLQEAADISTAQYRGLMNGTWSPFPMGPSQGVVGRSFDIRAISRGGYRNEKGEVATALVPSKKKPDTDDAQPHSMDEAK